MLRLKRLAVFCLFATCVISGLLFWALGQSGAAGLRGQPPPPQAGMKLTALPDFSARAVDITDGTVDPEWLARTAKQTGIPARALQAYAAAAELANTATPACRVGWNTVAAIGFVESGHGSHGGGSLSGTGQASGPIIGPSLDGGGFAAIPDTDDGVLDGDAVWDRAVGPMQFIPTTWDLAGRDGNGDGIADPLNIDDAALSAASYLCRGGRDLTTAGGWSGAVLSYNQSDTYLRQVRDQANEYAALS
ncbi:lytic transglycosylase domain-containing protein [Arthrobacter sp. B10-11]|uniref:lytic transglycosylase domain-containing protein n=1 Tax=Arthrobacter sp. B10-11 TaxID=3081160 RepID=UPI002953FD2E|nr:lytic transglycosylase domain-containing protein [Arthrobacter sp. B10-11]MDV8147831.1 lytic transglycosylase domain-containing protein [Arthrobacter sp. B10-11]